MPGNEFPAKRFFEYPYPYQGYFLVDLIEVGVDILNPIQTSVKGMGAAG